MRVIGVLAAVLTFGAASLVGVPAASAYLENGSDNPVAAAPPVSRPDTPHCTATLADSFPSNASDGSNQFYSGTLTPPAACPGPWAKVVLDETISVSGRQYDRVASLAVGGTTVYYGTTQEPSGAVPITYHVAKDITAYSALLRSPQPFSGGIENYTSSVYTGVYDQTVSITYYQADRRHPAAAAPDDVVGFASSVSSGSDTVHFGLSNLPRNITRAVLSLTLKGNGCDEQWFSSVPDDVAAKYPSAGMCPHGPFREANVALDGAPVGNVQTFPHIYTGGIVPTLWRPVVAIDALDMRDEQLDVTPFVGTLVDGGSHELTVTIAGDNDWWNVVATLFLYTDHHASRTSGAVLTDHVAPTGPSTTEKPLSDNGTRISVSAARRDVTAGYVDTSAGRVYTTVARDLSYASTDDVTAAGMAQLIHQTQSGSQTVTSTVGGRTTVTRHSFAYPLSIDFSAADYTDDQNFSLTATVEMAQHLSDAVDGRTVGTSTEWLRSYGILARVDGTNTESDGNSRTTFHGTDDQGRWYIREIVTDHGRVVSDTSR